MSESKMPKEVSLQYTGHELGGAGDYVTLGKSVNYIREDLAKSPEWETINTAPRNGTEILIYQPDRPIGKHATVVWWENEKWAFVKTDQFIMYVADRITHWKPIPAPPNKE